MMTYSDNSIVVLDQIAKQMLAACGGTDISIQMKWI